jgi:hypothetical protein
MTRCHMLHYYRKPSLEYTFAGGNSAIQVDRALQSLTLDFQQQLEMFNDAIGARLDHLSDVCSQLAQSYVKHSDIAPAANSRSQDRVIDRFMNLMMFVVAEDKDAVVWRRNADSVIGQKLRSFRLLVVQWDTLLLSPLGLWRFLEVDSPAGARLRQ